MERRLCSCHIKLTNYGHFNHYPLILYILFINLLHAFHCLSQSKYCMPIAKTIYIILLFFSNLVISIMKHQPHSCAVTTFSSFNNVCAVLLLLSILFGSSMFASAGNFYQDIDIIWGGDRSKILYNGDVLSVSLDKISGSGFQSKNEYLYAKIDMQIKLVPGNSAGTVTAYYVSNKPHFDLYALIFAHQLVLTLM